MAAFQTIPPRKPNARRKGFTLAELMISIGVLGIGLTMVASLFPLGLHENQDCVRYALANTITENGLAIVKAVPAASINSFVGTSTVLVPLFDETLSGRLPAAWLHFPTAVTPAEYKRGFLAMVRKVNDDNNSATDEGHQIVIVAWEKTGPVTNQVKPIRITYTVDANDAKIITAAADLFAGSPLIDEQTGMFSMIVSANDGRTACTLDRPLRPAGASAAGYVIAEMVGTTDKVPISPAMAPPRVVRVNLKQ